MLFNYVYVYAHVCAGTSDPPGVEVLCSCEPHSVGAGNQTEVLCPALNC